MLRPTSAPKFPQNIYDRNCFFRNVLKNFSQFYAVKIEKSLEIKYLKNGQFYQNWPKMGKIGVKTLEKQIFLDIESISASFISLIFTTLISRKRENIKIYIDQVEWDDITRLQENGAKNIQNGFSDAKNSHFLPLFSQWCTTVICECQSWRQMYAFSM